MANTYNDDTGDGSNRYFNLNFEYLQDNHVKVKVDGAEVGFVINTDLATKRVYLDTAPANLAKVKVYRDSRGDFSPLVDFEDGSVLTQVPLDLSYKHNLFVAQEASEGTGNELLNKKGGANYDAEGNKIINLGTPTTATDAATKSYVDQTIDNAELVGGSPATVSLGAYDVTSTNDTVKELRAWTADIESIADGAVNVTSTGSSEARSLANRFADFVNILDYGASTSNSAADNTTAINSAVSAALSNGKALYIPTGVFECNSIEIDFSGAKHLKILGQVGGRAGELQSSGVSCLDFPSLSGSEIGLNFSSASGAEYMGLYIQDLELRGPSLQAGTNPSTNTTGLFIRNGRDTVLDNVHITEFRTGLHATSGWSWHDMNCKIARCHVGAKFDYAGTYGLQAALHTKLRVNDCTYGVMQESTGHTYVDPWFEGQGPTNDREMEHAVVIGSATGHTEEITFIDGWWEQIQNYPIKIGYYDNGTGGNAVNLANSNQTIDDIRISTYGHWDSVGLDVGQGKIDINPSATNIVDQAVRIDGELSNWDWSMVNGDASKATSTFNFINHVAHGQRLSQFTTSGTTVGKGAQGNCWAGQKVNIPDNTATDVLSFSVPNKECGALFRLDYVIIANSEQSMASGSVLLMLGRKPGYATQGSVGTPENTNLTLISGITMTTPVFAFSAFQALDTVETSTETFTLKLTQDNSSNLDATFAWKIEELSSARQANFQNNFITVSQAS